MATPTVELLQTMIRNRCVNDGSAESGEEIRNVDTLEAFLDGSGLAIERYEAAPGRGSLVARIEGRDPDAPSLALMGHTDVVTVDESGWSRDPFAGELVGDEVWGRGAVDMLNLTASMAVAMRQLAAEGFKPRGDLVFVACADEESASTYGMRWLADHHRDAIYADYVLTENGGIHSGDASAPTISMNVAEKGVAWRRLRVHGVPGHGSTPFRSNNALVKAAAVVSRLADYNAPPRFHELWRQEVEALGFDAESQQALLDEKRIDQYLAELPNAGIAAYLHACTHTTFSCNVATGTGMKTNVIPATVEIDVDIRTVPGDNADEVMDHLRAALGDLADDVDVDVITHSAATISPIDTPAWDSLHRAVSKSFPGASLHPSLIVGFTDARIYRELGAVAYGAGLLSPEVNAGEFGRRFHGNDERIDLESLRLTTDLWLDVARDLLS